MHFFLSQSKNLLLKLRLDLITVIKIRNFACGESRHCPKYKLLLPQCTDFEKSIFCFVRSANLYKLLRALCRTDVSFRALKLAFFISKCGIIFWKLIIFMYVFEKISKIEISNVKISCKFLWPSQNI